jgi:hypothetical protein
MQTLKAEGIMISKSKHIFSRTAPNIENFMSKCTGTLIYWLSCQMWLKVHVLSFRQLDFLVRNFKVVIPCPSF